MKNSRWQKIIGLGLSVFLLFVGSVGLTGCETGGEETEVEVEEEDGEIEVEED